MELPLTSNLLERLGQHLTASDLFAMRHIDGRFRNMKWYTREEFELGKERPLGHSEPQ